MKTNRTYLFIAISSAALLVLLIIQVNWILQTAKIKEEIFNDKANMVLSRTTEELCADVETCQRISSCMEKDSTGQMSTRLGAVDSTKIDSLFNHFMNYYHFRIDYTFVVIQKDKQFEKTRKMFMNNSFCMPIEGAAHTNDLQLKLIIPEKKQFIMAEMGTMFISSVLLILIVLVLFWRTILSLLKEKKIAEHTTEFLNNMTHEFKTPLTNIALAAKMIGKDTAVQADHKVQQYSEIILQENEKLRLQVEQVLSMTALERGEIPLHKTEVEVHALLQEALKCMSLQIESKNGKVNLLLEAPDTFVFADKAHLLNAICNLIDNAIKYTEKDLVLSIHTFLQEGDWVLQIKDNGIGIEKAYQTKVFDTFFRVPTGDVHNVKGFGLGLAYVKKIIDLHGGSITLQSEKGKGSVFTIKWKHEQK